MTSTVTSEETVIRGLLAGHVAAMRAGDADAVTGAYLEDAVTFDLAPPLLHTGADADALRRWFATFDGPVDFESRDLRVTVGDGVAFCHSVNRMSATPRGASEGFDLWFRETMCLRKVAGAWRIAHDHSSTPFYMDGSFRAAVDLKPEG